MAREYIFHKPMSPHYSEVAESAIELYSAFIRFPSATHFAWGTTLRPQSCHMKGESSQVQGLNCQKPQEFLANDGTSKIKKNMMNRIK